MKIITSMNFRYSIHVFHAIIFAKVKSPSCSNLEDLCALYPEESVRDQTYMYTSKTLWS